ncbi:unnamed protein product [Acanthoscelides obtectus]|uniref:Uncharacterized protein n=1 Tax=Acanthoscelides obtectus TaxID=200917 RepID=A0A9P0LH54_ACAOB|nr:unnamed protein product [Acanthoscelides obtectus]CAK1621342.1 hypothetical protein AOBTE_LOCUS903 [Acanthoscelides obtectus]
MSYAHVFARKSASDIPP